MSNVTRSVLKLRKVKSVDVLPDSLIRPNIKVKPFKVIDGVTRPMVKIGK